MSSGLEYLDQDSTFHNRIETDNNICKSCYRKVREVNSPHEMMPDSVSSIVDYEDEVDSGYFDDKTGYFSEHKKTGRPSKKQRYCPCGSVDWNNVKVRPMSYDQMIDSGRRIVSHLDEKGVEVDQNRFFEALTEKASEPEHQYQEESVFEEAVEISVVSED